MWIKLTWLIVVFRDCFDFLRLFCYTRDILFMCWKKGMLYDCIIKTCIEIAMYFLKIQLRI